MITYLLLVPKTILWLEGEINEQGLRCGPFPPGKSIHNMWNQQNKKKTGALYNESISPSTKCESHQS